MDLDGGVAVRVAALCLDPNGRLSDRLICSAAIRGALLVDLALAGRLESTDDSIVVDDSPTGFTPADRLLAAIAVEPERSLDGWMDERRIGLRDLAEANVASGRWQVARRGVLPGARRYLDLLPDATDRDRWLHRRGPAAPWTPPDAAVAVIGFAAGLVDPGHDFSDDERDAILWRAERVGWLCAAVVDHLRATDARYRIETTGLGPF
jgi:hypothetical protein